MWAIAISDKISVPLHSVTNTKKKKLSSLGILTGRVLPWIEFFFIQKQRSNEQIAIPRTARFQINLKTGEQNNLTPAGLTKQ